MSGFTWIPVFKAISNWLAGQQNEQPHLVELLNKIGITNGLDDRNSSGNFKLNVMDPFTFYSMLMKHSEKKRIQLFTSLIELLQLNVSPPQDFAGVPTAQGVNARLFPYEHSRDPETINQLWEVFHKAAIRNLDDAIFSEALKIENIGFTKLTQSLFYAYPDIYLPIDKQTKPWLLKHGIKLPEEDWSSYEQCLSLITKKFSDRTFASISYEAWKSNLFTALDAVKFLKQRYPAESISETKHLVSVKLKNKRELALDPKLTTATKVFLSVNPDKELFDGKCIKYPTEKSRHHHFDSNAPSLSVGNEIYLLTLNSREQLESLCNWYEGSTTMETLDGKDITKSMTQELNQILYGPPGTGKTYQTTELAVKLAEPEWFEQHFDNDDKDALRLLVKQKYVELENDDRIAFTTFHQSYSYEDFIEGIRAITNENSSTISSISYEIEDGVFKKIADKANQATFTGRQLGISSSPRVWKISVGKREEYEIRNACLDKNEARIGWNDTGDLSLELDQRSSDQINSWESLSEINKNTILNFSDDMKKGDVLLCLKDKTTIQAIGVVTGDYFYDESATKTNSAIKFAHCRPVNWFMKGIELNISELNQGKRLVQKTVYALDRMNWDDLLKAIEDQGLELPVERSEGKKPNYVLIIDEINRGNISKIFGELITLIESDKRKGAHDARESLLPYSKKRFSIPSNLFLIGTMNTADKSLASIDLALRRRFSFIELMPKPELLKEIHIYDFKVSDLLRTLNDRIEVLLDRDHLIGHSYFWSLMHYDEISKEEKLAFIFEKKIIPLLQEYFFSDWERICWVLNDLDKNENDRFIQMYEESDLSSLFSDKISEQLQDRRYRINKSAFANPLAYSGIFIKQPI